MAPQEEAHELKQARIVEPSTPLQPNTQESATPPTPVASVPPVSQPHKKKRRKLLPVLIGVAAVVLLGGGAVSAYTFWYQNPDRVVADAMNSMLDREEMQQTTVITSDSVVPLGFFALKFNEVTFDSTSDTSDKSAMKLTVDMEFNGRPYQLGGEAVVVDQNTAYFKLNDMKETYLKFIEDMGVGEAALTPRANELIAEIDNTWVKADMNDQDTEDDELSCVLNEIGNSETAVTRAVKDAYAKPENQFMVIDEQLTPKDGNLGYRIKIDRQKMEQFATAVSNDDQLKNLQDCIDEEAVDETSGSVDQANDNAEQTIDIWVSRWTHELREVNFTINQSLGGDESDQKLTFNGTTKISDAKDLKVSIPENARPLEDWQRSFEALDEELSAAPIRPPVSGAVISNQL